MIPRGELRRRLRDRRESSPENRKARGARAAHACRAHLAVKLAGSECSFTFFSPLLSLRVVDFSSFGVAFDHRAPGTAVTFKPAVGRGSLVSGPCRVEKSMQPGVYNNAAVTAHHAADDVDSSRALRHVGLRRAVPILSVKASSACVLRARFTVRDE